jgi:hypothetical protein
MKQTAVEWLIDEIKFARNLCDDPSAEMDIWHTLDVLIAKGEEAKDMEKHQILNTYIEASPRLGDIIKEASERYYNETFNTKDNG